MHHLHRRNGRARKPGIVGALARASGIAAAGLSLAGNAAAIDFGPFSLTGFAKAEVTRVSPHCKDNSCQVDPAASKEFIWADELVQGKGYGAETTTLTLFQPYLSFKQDLPRGFEFSALISQRWRDGGKDFKGYWYDKSIALGHEDYGRLTFGAMQTRSWSMADYPFGSNIGLGDPWASSGAGYGLLTRALRYTSRPFDVLEGDLVLEATYDPGEKGWDRNDPRFVELWAQYTRGDLQLNLMVQDTKNGTPSAFGHGPFTGPFYDTVVDPLIGGNSQGIVMLMGTYQVDSQIELSGGIRANRWSGAYAKFLFSAADNPLGNYDLWSNPFNVDWSNDLGGGVYKGYSARSLDVIAGVRYKFGKWAASSGLMHLGAASTDNPSERGQSNSATIGTVGLSYDWIKGFRLYGTAGLVKYGRKGLSPTSMPANYAFTGVDSRIATRGNWFTAGVEYTF